MALRRNPALERGEGFRQLVVGAAMHGYRGEAGWQREGFDIPVAWYRCRQRHAHLDSDEARPELRVARERLSCQRAATAERMRDDPAQALADRGRDLIAWYAGADDQRVLRLQRAHGGGEHGHGGTPPLRLHREMVEPKAGCDTIQAFQPLQESGVAAPGVVSAAVLLRGAAEDRAEVADQYFTACKADAVGDVAQRGVGAQQFGGREEQAQASQVAGRRFSAEAGELTLELEWRKTGLRAQFTQRLSGRHAQADAAGGPQQVWRSGHPDIMEAGEVAGLTILAEIPGTSSLLQSLIDKLRDVVGPDIERILGKNRLLARHGPFHEC